MNSIAHADISPAFAERNIPVALATDENYLPYLKVTINSAIASSPGSNLDIIVLHAGIPEDAVRAFVAGYAGVGNASVRFVDISDELVASGLSGYKQTARLPLSACYRLLLPRVLAAYDKVVYIDVDVAVCRDLGELYATDVGDNYFAAAKDVVYTTKPEYVSWAAKWGFAEWDGYVNTGVLIMNLERFRREPVFDRLKEIVFEASKWLCDQDALNFVCKGAIAPLDPRWNVQLGDYCLEKQIAMTGEEMWVAHYTGSQKPWKLPARRYSHLWWRHAAEPDVSCLWTDAWGEALVQPIAGVPKVSVIIPVYNSARYLPEALASVLMQKDIPEIEVICIDDGSTDDSAAILDFWEKRDPRLKVLRQVNAGPGVARNAGIDAAKGEYIFFLDADDRLSSGTALLDAYNQSKADDLDILIANGSEMAENGTEGKPGVYLKQSLLPNESVFGPEALGANLYLVTPMAPWGKLYRRSFLAENKLRFPALRRSEDFPMVQLALSLSRRIGVMQMPVVDRRIGVASSLESTKDETPLIFFEAEQLLRDSLKERKLWSRFKSAVFSAFVVRLLYNLQAARRYSNFRAIIDKYRQECQQWICWDDVAMPERFVDKVQLVKTIEKEMEEDDQVALFVSLKESVARAAVKEKASKDERIKTLAAQLEERNRAVADRDKWLADAREGAKRRDAEIAKRDKWLADAREGAKRRDAEIAKRDQWLAEAREGVKRRDAEIVKRNQWLAEAREGAKRRDAEIAKRDEWLADAREGAKRRDAEIAKRDKWLADAREGALRHTQELQVLKQRIFALEALLQSLRKVCNES